MVETLASVEAPAPSPGSRPGHVAGRGLLVFAAAALALRIANAAGAALLGAHDLERFATLVDAELAIGHRLPIPAYYPARYQWPPRISRLAAADAVVLALESAADQRATLFVIERPAGAAQDVADGVIPDLVPFHQSVVAIDGVTGRLQRAHGPDGAIWTDIEWTDGAVTRRVAARGDDVDLLRLAASIGPRSAP